MSRRDPAVDPAVTRELAELDAVLAGDAGADPALALLVSDVRALAPRMAPVFAAGLDEQVQAGFAAGPPPVARWLGALRSRTMLLPALGLAAAMLVALVVVLDVARDSSMPTRQPSTEVLAPDTKPAVTTKRAPVPSVPGTFLNQDSARRSVPLTGAGSVAAPARPAARSAKPGFGRKVEKSTELSLRTTADGVQDAADGVVRVVQSLGGIVESSQVTTAGRGGTATFTLRVPVDRLDDAVRRLSALAHVASLTQNVQDITGSFVSTASRLSDARAERRALLRALGKATTANEIASLRARLRLNASEIAAYKGELNSLRRRANFARVDVTITGRGRAPSTGAGAWTPRDALHDALRVLEVAAGVLVVTAAALTPVALLAVLAALAARSLRRRRREQALDAAA
jgi:hypothetical protein